MIANPPWRVAWVTGASSGIGREVALQLARAGVKVAASARSADGLAKLAAEQPGISAFPLDVTDAGAVAGAVTRIETAFGAIDLAILSAGVGDTMGARKFDGAKVAATMAVNYLGVTNAVAALMPLMIARRSGHLAFVASLAGYRGLPYAAAYCPSKAAVISLAEALQPDVARLGVKVSVINPGFVETPMTAANKVPMPYMVKADDAGRRIVAGLQAGKFEIAFPWQLVTATKIARMLPYSLYFWLARKMLERRKPEA